jgi:hypothetical protein
VPKETLYELTAQRGQRGEAGEAAVDEDRVEMVSELINELRGEEKVDLDEVRRLVTRAYKVTDEDFELRDAIEWGQGFRWPEEVFVRDWEVIERAGGLERAVQERHESMKCDRLSTERIDRWIEEGADKERLKGLVGGMQVFVSDDFSPNLRPPPMRSVYRQAAGAVNRLLLDLWHEGLVFIVPTIKAMQIMGVHFSPTHWARKAGKRGGRNIFDSTDNKHGCAINSEGGKNKIIQAWGEIQHPTLDDLVRMIHRFSKKARDMYGEGFKWEDVVIWKADLSKAFTLLNFRPADVRLLACELSDGLTLFYHTGLFGWTGTPYAFQVVTRALKQALQMAIRGEVEVYVDDLMGVTLRHLWEEDRSQVKEVCEGLLGSKAIAVDKWECGRCLDWLGWRVDLCQRSVGIKERNFMRALYSFFTVNEDSKIKVKTLQRLASYAARYSTVMRQMRPLTAAIYSQFHGMRDLEAAKYIDSYGKLAIRIWRAWLCLLELRGPAYERQFETFIDREPTVEIRFDASLTGLGVSVWDVSGNCERILGVTSLLFPFDLHGDSRFQNTAEFTAVVVGCVCLVQKGYVSKGIRLVGDSLTSLVWSQTERFRGLINLNAAMAFTVVGGAFDLWVAEVRHVAGTENEVHDKMSRGAPPQTLGFKNEDVVDINNDGWLQLCNPYIRMGERGVLEEWWRKARALVDELRNVSRV